MRKYVPGHFWGSTIWIVIVAASVVGLATKSARPTVGIVIAVIGAFLSDQAVHLDQPAHREVAPTWLERSMQQSRYLWQGIGLSVVAVGFAVMFR